MNYAPSTLQVDRAEDGKILDNMMNRAEHQFQGGFHQNMPGHTAESQEEGMKIVMCIAMHKEAKRLIIREGDHALIVTTFTDVGITEAAETEEVVMDVHSSKVSFSIKWVIRCMHGSHQWCNVEI